MERVQELIDKLYQQRMRNEGALQLLPTVQQLYDALLSAAQRSIAAQSEKVAVVMPSKPRVPLRTNTDESGRPAVVVPPQAPAAALAPKPQPIISDPPPVQPAPQQPLVVAEVAPVQPVPQPEPVPVNPPLSEEYMLHKPGFADVAVPPSAEPKLQQPEPKPEQNLQPNLFVPHFDTTEEAPTLLQQPPKQPPREIHELISEPGESLNDRLKQERTELAHVLKDTPIKDLRKAIGVNDKFLFVNELFRGDEAMYERSIKTINGFHIFPEAEYWINRELKVKLGWDDRSQTVKHFYHLVKRRFS